MATFTDETAKSSNITYCFGDWVPDEGTNTTPVKAQFSNSKKREKSQRKDITQDSLAMFRQYFPNDEQSVQRARDIYIKGAMSIDDAVSTAMKLKQQQVDSIDSLAPYREVAKMIAQERQDVPPVAAPSPSPMINTDEILTSVISIHFSGTPEELDRGGNVFTLTPSAAMKAFNPENKGMMVAGKGVKKTFAGYDQTRGVIVGVKALAVSSNIPCALKFEHSAQPINYNITATGETYAFTIHPQQQHYCGNSNARVLFDGIQQLSNPTLMKYGAQTVQSLIDNQKIIIQKTEEANVIVATQDNPFYDLIKVKEAEGEVASSRNSYGDSGRMYFIPKDVATRMMEVYEEDSSAGTNFVDLTKFSATINRLDAQPFSAVDGITWGGEINGEEYLKSQREVSVDLEIQYVYPRIKKE